MADVRALPPELTSFIGRRSELHWMTGALAQARLVTLTGPGGCGKTRLALRLAHGQLDRRRDGLCWVDLAHETKPDMVAWLVAAALDVVLPPEAEATLSLVRQLEDRELLVVLDNCEHLMPAVAEVVSALLLGCAHVTVLATSRELLGVPGEVVARVAPLEHHDAVALFTERGGEIAEDALAAVYQICSRLDGIPLALELAAAWTGTLSPQEILRELDDRFGVLVAGSRTAPPRHQTLRASMAWSHDLLDQQDQILFRRLGVFQTGFTRAAVQEVCPEGGLEILIGLRRLIGKSLLIAETHDGVARYHMLETVRHYALERLAEAGELDVTRERHLSTYLGIVEGLTPLLDTDKDAWRAEIHPEYPNLRAAIEWGLSREDAGKGRQLAAALAWLWHLESHRHEGLHLLRLAVARGEAEHGALQARLLTGVSLTAHLSEPGEGAFVAATAARSMALEHGDRRTAALALSLSAVGVIERDLGAAGAMAAQAQAEGAELGYRFVEEANQVMLGILHHLQDDHVAALAVLGPASAGLAARGDRGVAATGLVTAAMSSAHTGDLRRAQELADQAVAMARPIADYHRLGAAHSAQAMVYGMRGLMAPAWQALQPVIRLADHFIPGLARAVGMIHLWNGEPAAAIAWFRREMSWRWPDASADDHLLPDTRVSLAAALRMTGDLETAEHVADSALEVARALGMPRLTADALEQKARLTDAERAATLHHEALTIRVQHGLRLACVDSLDALAEVSVRRAAPQVGARLLGAADRAREELEYPRHWPDPDPEKVRRTADDDAIAEGRLLDLDEAIAYAQRARTSRRRPATGWASLTPAEREVVQLAVTGLTNPDIATRLFMSRSTVKTHLAHVYAKLNVANRTELAKAATEEAQL